MKLCKDCDFYKTTAMAQGNQMSMVPICTNSECCDPIDGSPLPCQVVRPNPAFCGMGAKYFKVKEITPETNVIKLV